MKLFILQRHASLSSDLSQGRGEDLDALLSLLHIAEPQRLTARDTIQALSRAYPDPLAFAEHVMVLASTAGRHD